MVSTPARLPKAPDARDLGRPSGLSPLELGPSGSRASASPAGPRGDLPADGPAGRRLVRGMRSPQPALGEPLRRIIVRRSSHRNAAPSRLSVRADRALPLEGAPLGQPPRVELRRAGPRARPCAGPARALRREFAASPAVRSARLPSARNPACPNCPARARVQKHLPPQPSSGAAAPAASLGRARGAASPPPPAARRAQTERRPGRRRHPQEPPPATGERRRAGRRGLPTRSFRRRSGRRRVPGRLRRAARPGAERRGEAQVVTSGSP